MITVFKHKHIIWLVILLGLFFSFSSTFATKDIMEVMFAPAKAQEKLIDLGVSKDDVWDEVFRSSTKIWLTKKGCFIGEVNKPNFTSKEICEKNWGVFYKTNIKIQEQAPLLVRITKFVLRITIVLSITMIIFNGILWIVESSKWGEVKDAKNNLIYIFVWLILALSSVALVNLISSLGMSSLDPNNLAENIAADVDCTMLTEKENSWKEKKCILWLFWDCKKLKPYHDIFKNKCTE